jgi:RNAse (barnase) inhibitor barstar
MIANQRGEGAHLLDALWLCALGDVTNLRRLRLQCRNSGQKIAEHEISEMIEYLEESETTRLNHLRDWSDSREVENIAA